MTNNILGDIKNSAVVQGCQSCTINVTNNIVIGATSGIMILELLEAAQSLTEEQLAKLLTIASDMSDKNTSR